LLPQYAAGVAAATAGRLARPEPFPQTGLEEILEIFSKILLRCPRAAFSM
jgi:hypothetical protein